ncbi:hypothetical protein MIR68_003480 [Amoeboaphelidium protococcarum]|nr:hypothetical protein MIR68_003480 [Amoeboaphelidium protococcarum]
MTESENQQTTTEKSYDNQLPTELKLKDFVQLIDEVKTCLMTTRRSDGQLVSRVMAIRKHDEKATKFWFVTDNQSHKMEEIGFDNHVNLGFYKPASMGLVTGSGQAGGEWFSVSGHVSVVDDPALKQELWAADMKTWLTDLRDGVHDASVNDPRYAVLEVVADSICYSRQDQLTAKVLYEFAKGVVTGEPAKMNSLRMINKEELTAEQ